MKKRAHLLLLILLLSVPAVSQAEDISIDKARKVAETFFNRYGVSTRSSSQLTLVNADEVAATRSASEVAFYIFNRQGGGFVIVSALDAACPVLGYSLDHEFGTGDDMPANLAEWLDLYRQQIRERRQSGKAATADELARWREVTQATRAVPNSIELNTANWGQGAPYNGLCPLDSDGKKTIAGCVAIAISQVVYYHRHPNAGTGTLPSYAKNGITIPKVVLGHQYQYDKMLHKYKGATYTQEQSDAVARLVYDIAVMAQASFGSSSTSASTSSAVPRLRTYFGYDQGMIRYARNYLDDTGWKSMLKEEIGNSYPVIFSATSSSSGGGHAFVVDGYDSSDRFHINWGWNGSSNGYYQLNAFGAYTVSQVAYTRVKPDEGNQRQYHLALREYNGKGKGLEYKSGTATQGSSLTVDLGIIYNYSYDSCAADITFGHFSKDGTLKSLMMAEPFHISLGAGSYYTSVHAGKVISITQPIERGDYVEALFRPDGYTEWQHFYNAANPGNGIIGRIPLHIKDFSTIKYASGSRKLVIGTFTGSKFAITDKDGNPVRSGNINNTSYTINMTDTDRYPAGRYTFSITCGDQSLAFDVILGNSAGDATGENYKPSTL